MNSIPIHLRDRLIDDLQTIAGRTEEIFLVLAQSLPSLVSEMNRSLERSRAVLSDVQQPGDVTADSGSDISEVVSQLRSEMQRGNSSFMQMATRDSELFTHLQHGIEQLETIAENIHNIREDSEEMELVSLNAMTVALKAGTAGRAFSYITEELKRLANRTIALSEEISYQGSELMENFRTLERQLDDAQSFHDNLVKDLQTRISSSLGALDETVHETVAGLRELRDGSTEVREPINGMMEAIQLQDLIRQSIDHIILSLKAIRPEGELTSQRALLDELAFIVKIPQLASRLIDDVAGQIDHSVTTFSRLTSRAEERVQSLKEAEGALISGTSANSPEGTDTTIHGRFASARDMLQQLLDDLQRSVEKKTTLVSRSNSMTSLVETLEIQFRAFTTLVRRFHSIDIAARIEVAKQEALRRMGTSTDHMTRLTHTIEGHITDALETTQEFIRSISQAIEHYQSHFEVESRFVRDFGASIREQYTALTESHRVLTDVIGEFSLFTDSFLTVFNTSKENGLKLADLSREIRNLKGDLLGMEREIEGRYRNELETQERDSWSIENDRLKEIIQRFTILTQKQQAGELIGMDVEGGVEAGDVTLF